MNHRLLTALTLANFALLIMFLAHQAAPVQAAGEDTVLRGGA